MNGLVDQDIEQAVLTAIFWHPEAIWNAADLRGEHFGSPLHGRIFDICLATATAHGSFDSLSVTNALGDDPDLLAEDGPGRSYVHDLAASMAVPTAMVREHAKSIINLARRRALVTISERLRNEAETVGGKTVEEMVADVEREVSLLGSNSTDATDHRTVLDRMAKKFSEQKDCVSTGLRCLDKSMGGGLYEGMTYGFEGMQKAGKSALVSSISYNLNEAGVPHLYLAAEMGSIRLAQRMVARSMRRRSLEMLFKPKDFVAPVIQYRAVAPNNILWADMPGPAFKEIRRRVTSIMRRTRIRGFILDGWQLVKGVEKGTNLEQHLRDVAQWVADFCNDHGLFGIITAQLNQNGVAHSCSQGLEMACDQVYVLDREEGGPQAWMRQKMTRYTPIMHVGSPDDRPLVFNGDGPFFEDFDGEPPQRGLGFDDE